MRISNLFKRIKDNPLYLFVIRVVSILILSSIAWTGGIFFYNEYEIADNIDKRMQKDIATLEKKISYIDFVNKNEKFNNYILELKKQMNHNGVLFYDLYDKEHKPFLRVESDIQKNKKIDRFLEKFDATSESREYKLIPISEDDVYIYYQSTIRINSNKYFVNLLMTLNEDTIELIKGEIDSTLVIVFITILIVFISIFPIVFSQYKNLIEKNTDLIKSNINTIMALGNAIAKRDSDTYEHNYRVTYYSIKIAEKMNLSKEQIKTLIKGAFLHDVGKIGISDNILLKPAKLTEEEFEIMKTHVVQGTEIVQNIPWLEEANEIILNHHEKVDGTGYPNAKMGKDIPIEAKIFAVADVFDALTSQRPYKKPFSLEKSIEILLDDSGTHFDIDVVYVFKEIHEDVYNNIYAKNSKELEIIFHQSLNPYFFK